MTQQKNQKSFRSRAPGKVILSGEHAVLYGAPALAMAVNRYVTTSIAEEKNLSTDIMFDSSSLNFHSELDWEELRRLHEKISKRYQEFLENKISIEQVLVEPGELLLYLLVEVFERFSVTLTHKISIKIDSTIPIGSGMGSSAASIISFLHALVEFFSLPLKLNDYVGFGREIENLQHGKSSGLDLCLATYSGTVLFQDGRGESISHSGLPMFFVYSGQPECSTGASVEAARKRLSDIGLLREFGEITIALIEALEEASLGKAQKAISANQRLLERISVVPEKVRVFMRAAKENGMAAKICGAGAVLGDKAGILLLLGEDKAKIECLVRDFGYKVLDLKEEKNAVQII